jgi:hypothetical protein
MDLIKRNTEQIAEIDRLVENIWENVNVNNKAMIACIKNLNGILKEFIGRIEEFLSYGVDIPEEVILTQMKNLMDGFENQDSVLLADTLEYEIKNTILFYNDILNELEKEQV